MTVLSQNRDHEENSYYFWGKVDFLGNVGMTNLPNWLTYKTDRIWVVPQILPFVGTYKLIRRVSDLESLEKIASTHSSFDWNLKLPEFVARRVIQCLQRNEKQCFIPIIFREYHQSIEKLITLVSGKRIPVILSHERVRGNAGEVGVRSLLTRA